MELKESEFKNKMKDTCSICEQKIEKDWNLYKMYGNFCTRCSTRADRVAIGKITPSMADLEIAKLDKLCPTYIKLDLAEKAIKELMQVKSELEDSNLDLRLKIKDLKVEIKQPNEKKDGLHSEK